MAHLFISSSELLRISYEQKFFKVQSEVLLCSLNLLWLQFDCAQSLEVISWFFLGLVIAERVVEEVTASCKHCDDKSSWSAGSQCLGFSPALWQGCNTGARGTCEITMPAKSLVAQGRYEPMLNLCDDKSNIEHSNCAFSIQDYRKEEQIYKQYLRNCRWERFKVHHLCFLYGAPCPPPCTYILAFSKSKEERQRNSTMSYKSI